MPSEIEHWCGNCQIRIYIRRHCNKDIDWQDCPYTCEYATDMRNSYGISIDDVPVRLRHGRWVNHISENGATDGTYCSICDYEVDRDARYNYCPPCGAKMDITAISSSSNPNPNEKSGRDTEE